MNAFQILGFFDFTDTGINLLKSLYGTLARVYDFLLQLASGTSANNFSSVIEGITSTFYAIAGVFMLFRITISAVNMLINPDEISDKNAGGSKLITNIIVTIMLLFLLQPGGFIYTQLGRLETAILGDSKTNDPGFISELIKPVQSTASVDNSNKVNNAENDIANSLPFIENVYAAGPLTCYFVQPVGRLADSGEHGIIKLTFYDSKVAGSVSISNADESYPGYVVSGAGTSESFQYNNESRSIRFINYFGNNSYAVPKVGSPGIADAFIDEFPTSCSSITLRAESGADLLNFDGPVYLVNDNWFQNSKSWNTASIGTGYSDLSSAYARYIKYLSNSSENNDATITNDNPNHDQLTDDAENYNDYIASLNVNQSAVDFSNAVISSFYNCNNVSDKVSEEDHATCEKMVTQILNEDTDDIQDFINDDIIDWDFLIGLLLGFAFIIYIVFLCIDVIVRNFKIILLQMIAPIPIINGIDPKDKMRSQWVKMYAGTYLSLFIKLFAIKLVSALLTIDVISEISTNSAFGGTMVKLFYIVALLVFAKLVPDILSKIFGLNDMAGSFKDIANMAKTTLGAGAAVALAGGAGVGRLATNTFSAYKNTQGTRGQKLKQALMAGGMGLASSVGSMVYAAGAGSKGKVMTGAQRVNRYGKDLNEKIKSGISPTAVASQRILGRANLDYAARTDSKIKNIKEKKDTLDKFTPFKGDMEKTAEEGKFMMTLRTAIKNGEVKLSEAKVQDLRSAWIESQITGDASILQKELDKNFTRTITEEYDTGITNSVTGETIKRTRETTIKDWDYQDNIIEGGKQSAIRSTLTKANDLLADNTDIASAAGVSRVESFSDLDNANKNVKKEATALDNEIFRRTTASTKYNISKEAKEATNNSNNNK